MSKHTPGPWHLATAPGTGCAPRIIKPGVHDICEMEGSESNDGVMADARLIAAAPDLLAALQAFVEANDKGIPEKWIMRMIDCDKLARAAIRKATGEA